MILGINWGGQSGCGDLSRAKFPLISHDDSFSSFGCWPRKCHSVTISLKQQKRNDIMWSLMQLEEEMFSQPRIYYNNITIIFTLSPVKHN